MFGCHLVLDICINYLRILYNIVFIILNPVTFQIYLHLPSHTILDFVFALFFKKKKHSLSAICNVQILLGMGPSLDHGQHTRVHIL